MSPRKESEKNKRLKLLGLAQASVAHAIKNPLVGIGGFIRRALKKAIELLKESEQTPKKTLKETSEKIDALKECIEQSVSDVTRLENLVTNILAYIKPHEPKLEQNNLNKIAQSAIEKKIADIKSSNKKAVIVFKKGKVPLLMLDAPQIELVILEIIQNAVNAISSKKEKITITTCREKNKVRLEIKNTGSVVPEDDRELIFTPLYTTGTGHGLGLAIAQAIVEAHGAEICVKSKKQPPETAFIIKFRIPR